MRLSPTTTPTKRRSTQTWNPRRGRQRSSKNSTGADPPPVSQIEIYIDEDAMDSDPVAALRSGGVTAITAMDAGLAGKSDDEQLAFAAEHGCVLYTFNVSDFYRLHTVWAGAGRE